MSNPDFFSLKSFDYTKDRPTLNINYPQHKKVFLFHKSTGRNC